MLPEQANLRAAIDWAADVDPELALSIAVALENFWVTNNPTEGRRRLRDLLERAPGAPPRLRAQALRALGGSSQIAGDIAEAEIVYKESERLFLDADDELGAAILRYRFATTVAQRGNVRAARGLVEMSLEEFSALGYDGGRCQALGTLGALHLRSGDRERGEQLLEQAAALASEIGFIWWAAGSHSDLARSALRAGELERAAAAARRALELHHLACLAECAARAGRVERAGRLRGILQAEQERRPPGPGWLEAKADLDHVLATLAGSDLDAAVRRGRALSPEQALDYALSDID